MRTMCKPVSLSRNSAARVSRLIVSSSRSAISFVARATSAASDAA